MKKTTHRIFTCPMCKKDVERQQETFPFCSERCQTLDIARWADGSYSIAGEPAAEINFDDEERLH